MNEKDFILVDSKSAAELSLFNIGGKVLFNKKINAGKLTIKKQYPVGEYVIRLIYQNYTTFEKIQIIKK